MPKSRLFNVDAVILRRSDYGEADRILTVFTADQGKLKLIAKGVRKTQSRKAGHVELFMHTALQVAEGRTWGVVTQAEIVEAFRLLREDLDKISQAYYLAELIDKFTEDHDPSFPLFELLLLTLARLSDGEGNIPFLAMRYFEMHLLRLTGYQPQLHFCLGCNETLQAIDNYFHTADGGTYCPTCGEARAHARLLPVGVLKVLRFLQTRSWDEAAKLQLTPTTRHHLETTLLDYITLLLEKRLKSVDFLRRLRQQQAQLAE